LPFVHVLTFGELEAQRRADLLLLLQLMLQLSKLLLADPGRKCLFFRRSHRTQFLDACRHRRQQRENHRHADRRSVAQRHEAVAQLVQYAHYVCCRIVVGQQG